MSSARQRLYRAVRVLPDSVRIGQAQVPEEDPQEQEGEAQAVHETDLESEGRKELDALKTRIMDIESELGISRERARGLELEMQAQRQRLEDEKSSWLLQAAKDAAQAKSAAEAEGRAEGLKKGEEEGRTMAETQVRTEYREKFDATAALIERVYAELVASKEGIMALQEPEMIRMWESILSRMLYTSVVLNPHTVSRVLQEVLSRTSDKERVMVYLNPSDVETVESTRDELIDIIRGIKHLEFSGDDHVDKGSCLVETSLGVYDARWRTQLEQVSKQVDQLLLDAIEEKPQEHGAA